MADDRYSHAEQMRIAGVKDNRSDSRGPMGQVADACYNERQDERSRVSAGALGSKVRDSGTWIGGRCTGDYR